MALRFTPETNVKVLPADIKEIVLDDVVQGETYNIRVLYEYEDGTYESVSFPHTVVGKASKPSPPTNVTVTAGPESVELTWDNPADVDLDKIHVYFNTHGRAPGFYQEYQRWAYGRQPFGRGPLGGVAIGDQESYLPVKALPGTKGHAVIKGLTPGKTYYFWLVAIDSNNPPVYSDRVGRFEATPITIKTSTIEDDAGLGQTADWSKVVGDGKPEDNATVGAPAGTPVGSLTAEEVEAAANKAAKALDDKGTLVTRVAPSQPVFPEKTGLFFGDNYLGFFDKSVPGWKSYLKSDGSASFASGKLFWDVDGNLTLRGGTIETASDSARIVIDPTGDGTLSVFDATAERLRLGTEGGVRGLHLYDSSGNLLATYGDTGLTIKEGGDITLSGTLANASVLRFDAVIEGGAEYSSVDDAYVVSFRPGTTSYPRLVFGCTYDIYDEPTATDVCWSVLTRAKYTSQARTDNSYLTLQQYVSNFYHDYAELSVLKNGSAKVYTTLQLNLTPVSCLSATNDVGDKESFFVVGPDYASLVFTGGGGSGPQVLAATPYGVQIDTRDYAYQTDGLYPSPLSEVSGPSSASPALTVVSNTQTHLRLEYDSANYADFTVDSAGNLEITPSGNLLSYSASAVAITNSVSAKALVLENSGTGTTSSDYASVGLRFRSNYNDIGYGIELHAEYGQLYAYNTTDDFTTSTLLFYTGAGSFNIIGRLSITKEFELKGIAEPVTPPPDHGYLFVDTNGYLKYKDPNGVVTTLSSAAGDGLTEDDAIVWALVLG